MSRKGKDTSRSSINSYSGPGWVSIVVAAVAAIATITVAIINGSPHVGIATPQPTCAIVQSLPLR
jgi:hypothetical protein